MKRLLIALIASLSIAPAFGQALLQGGPWQPGRAPMYVGQGNSQPIVQDSGPASGGGIGLGLAEQLLQVRSATNTYPAANAGTGQFSTNWCDYDGPTTNATGYHFLCMSPNAQGGGLIAYGAAGGASTLSLNFNVNGTTYPFPFSIGGIVGPGTSIVNDVACWNNITSTLLKDCGAAVSTSTSNTWTGTNNFTSTFQMGGATQTFPASGNLVGTSDVQTLTNKNIAASQINSGTLPGAQTPILSGDVTTTGGNAVTTIAANAVTNGKLATATQNTVKGAATSTAEADLSVPSCSSAGNALQWTTNTGFNCATLTNQAAGFGLQLSSNTFAISSSSPAFGYDMPVNMGLSANAAGSNLTINLTNATGSAPSASSPVLIPFRSATLATGTTTWTAVTSSLSLVIPSGATLGTSNNVAFRLWIYASYNSGTPQLGAAICSISTQIYPCSSWEYNRVTSTTISGLATIPGVLYATAGVSNDPVRIIGYCEFGSGLATVGAWASACTNLGVFGPGVKRPGEEVQVVYATTTTGVDTTSASYQTAITANITPSAASNLVRATFTGNAVAGASLPATAILSLFRSATNIYSVSIQNINTSLMGMTGAGTALDKPNTASSVAYTVQAVSDGTHTIRWGNAGDSTGAHGTLTLSEIMG